MSETWADPDLDDEELPLELATRLTDYVTAFEPANGAVVSRLLNQVVIRFSEDVFDSAGGTLDGTAGDYGLGAEISVIDVTGGGTLLAAATASCNSP